MTVLNWNYHNLTTETLIEKLNDLENPDEVRELNLVHTRLSSLKGVIFPSEYRIRTLTSRPSRSDK